MILKIPQNLIGGNKLKKSFTNIFLKILHVGYVILWIWLCFLQDYIQGEPIIVRLLVFLIMAGYATYSLFFGITSGSFFDADDIGDFDDIGE